MVAIPDPAYPRLQRLLHARERLEGTRRAARAQGRRRGSGVGRSSPGTRPGPAGEPRGRSSAAGTGSARRWTILASVRRWSASSSARAAREAPGPGEGLHGRRQQESLARELADVQHRLSGILGRMAGVQLNRDIRARVVKTFRQLQARWGGCGRSWALRTGRWTRPSTGSCRVRRSRWNPRRTDLWPRVAGNVAGGGPQTDRAVHGVSAAAVSEPRAKFVTLPRCVRRHVVHMR